MHMTLSEVTEALKAKQTEISEAEETIELLDTGLDEAGLPNPAVALKMSLLQALKVEEAFLLNQAEQLVWALGVVRQQELEAALLRGWST